MQHPEFSQVVNTIVVEFGNARYQSLMDRFVFGHEPISIFELRKVWRNTTQGAWFTWDNPVYAQFFRAVRAVNRALPKGQRPIRVLLGDPPVNWQTATAQAITEALSQRDQHFASVVNSEVIEKGRRALLIAGYGHTVRVKTSFYTDNLVNRLDQLSPGSVFTTLPHAPFRSGVQQLESRLAIWSVSSLMPLRNDWLGRTPASAVIEEVSNHLTLADIADAYLYLGPGQDMTASQEDPAVFRDPAFAKELQRRRRLLGLDGSAQVEKLEFMREPSIFMFPRAKR